MINHRRRYPSQTISTRVLAAAVSHSLARLCRLLRARKASGNDFSGIEQRVARQSHKLKVAGSNPAPAPSFHAGRGTAINLSWMATDCCRRDFLFFLSSVLSLACPADAGLFCG
jgi:hypothetical protein